MRERSLNIVALTNTDKQERERDRVSSERGG
jgi:hypothetical protein